jgi:tRNA G10  N-methylase Trm11
MATAMIAPESQTVGIEIAHNGVVNRDDVRKDFSSRNLTAPRDLLHGDSADFIVRDRARQAIGNKAFDTIIADPPYGIRESTGYNEKSPLEELFTSIALDRESGNRLLKKGGRLVAFVPVTDEETLLGQLPHEELTRNAGLLFELSREQILNTKLSRWLVSFICDR